MSGKKLHAFIALLAGAGIFAAAQQLLIALAAAGLLMQHNVTLAAAILLAVLSATTLFLLLRHLESKRELLRRSTYDAVSADLNHHIRNALQLILNQAEMMEVHRFSEFQNIREAVNRIDWALREILPRGMESPKLPPPKYGHPASKSPRKPMPHGRAMVARVSRTGAEAIQLSPELDLGPLGAGEASGKVCPWPRNEKS